MGLALCTHSSAIAVRNSRCFLAPNSLWESPSQAMAHGMG